MRLCRLAMGHGAEGDALTWVNADCVARRDGGFSGVASVGTIAPALGYRADLLQT
jgi:hypothetical protein